DAAARGRRNDGLRVLCRNTNTPAHAPIVPDTSADRSRVFSGIRRAPRRARRLSMPNSANDARFSTTSTTRRAFIRRDRTGGAAFGGPGGGEARRSDEGGRHGYAPTGQRREAERQEGAEHGPQEAHDRAPLPRDAAGSRPSGGEEPGASRRRRPRPRGPH